MEHTLVNTAKPIGKSVTTGTTLLQSFHAASGFNYQIGMRKAAGLTIVEGFAEGTGCSYSERTESNSLKPVSWVDIAFS